MSDVPLVTALGKVNAGSEVTVHAPEWSGQDRWWLGAKTLVALLLLAFAAVFLAMTITQLPAEEAADSGAAGFKTRAVQASKAVAAAQVGLQGARDDLQESRAALQAAKERVRGLPPQRRRDRLQEPRRAVVADKLEVTRKQRTKQRLVLERSAALSDVIAIRTTSEVDVARVIGLGSLSLVALIGAAALLAPRRSQLLTVAGGAPSAAPALGAGAAVGPLPAPGPPAGAPGGGATASSTNGPSSFVAREPSVTQGLVATAVLVAGLFGIQHVEGAIEGVINVAVAIVPLVGALFLRQRVAAKTSLTIEERARLFGS